MSVNKSDVVYHLLKRLAIESPYNEITYGTLAALIDSPRWRLAPVLKKVSERCAIEGIPDLTAFVVKQDGEPASGFNDVAPAETIRAAAFKQLSQPYWLNRKGGVHQDVDDYRYARIS